MSRGKFFYENLLHIAEKALEIETDVVKGAPHCARLADQVRLLRDEVRQHIRPPRETTTLLRDILALVYPARAEYILDRASCDDEVLGEPTLMLYAILSAVGHGDTDVMLTSRAAEMCAAIKKVSEERVATLTGRLPAIRPQKQPVIVQSTKDPNVRFKVFDGDKQPLPHR